MADALGEPSLHPKWAAVAHAAWLVFACGQCDTASWVFPNVACYCLLISFKTNFIYNNYSILKCKMDVDDTTIFCDSSPVR